MEPKFSGENLRDCFLKGIFRKGKGYRLLFKLVKDQVHQQNTDERGSLILCPLKTTELKFVDKCNE